MVSLNGFSRLCLGAHWLSDVFGGIAFWAAGAGHRLPPPLQPLFWVKPVAWLVYGVFAVAACAMRRVTSR
ncbi:hypothetical protein [Stenotrophomonas sp. S11A1a]|uniref:hypothetical protein n=1 Tax=Stenotrophomonas sp. S11A1a TaxID=3455011 RepID=UPI003F7A78BC